MPTEMRADFKSSSERTALLPRLDSVVLPSVISYLALAPSPETGTTRPNLTAEAFITCSSKAFIFVYHANQHVAVVVLSWLSDRDATQRVFLVTSCSNSRLVLLVARGTKPINVTDAHPIQYVPALLAETSHLELFR